MYLNAFLEKWNLISEKFTGVSTIFENLKIHQTPRYNLQLTECELVTFIYYIPVRNVKKAFSTIWLIFSSCENNEGWARICSQLKEWPSLFSGSSCKDVTTVYNNMFVKHFYCHTYMFTVLKPIELLLQNTPRKCFVSSPPAHLDPPVFFHAHEQLVNTWNRLIQSKLAFIANSTTAKRSYLTIARSGERTELPS